MSLPALSERGRGLSEIKGRDPMDRRIEVEKKERYAQDLRDQMAMNTEKNRRQAEHDGTNGSGSGFAVTAGGTRGSSILSRGFSSPAGCRLETTAAPPPSGGHQLLEPTTSAESNRMSGVGETNWGTSDKVAQVQDLMRQRINSVQEEQQRQWKYIQEALHEHSNLAAQTAEDSIRRALDAASASQAEELRRALDQVGAAQAESAAQSRRSEALQADVSGLRSAVEQLQAQDADQQQQLGTHSREIESLKHAHEECARFRAEVQRELAAFHQELAALAVEQRQQLEEHRMQIERLHAGREDDSRALAKLAEGQQVHGDGIARLQNDVQELALAASNVPGQLQKLREDMPRLAESAARAVLKGMKPPQPVVVVQEPPPQPMPVCAPDISENAFAALRNGDGDVFELPDLRNTVGRSPQCNACVSGSQQISNKHSSINFNSEGQVSIQDMGSRNGTFLEDKRVPVEHGVILESGDAIRLGADGPTYVFEYGPAFYARWPREPQRVNSSWGTARTHSQRAR